MSSQAVIAARQESAAGRRPAAIPWFVWSAVAAVTSAIVGLEWDISWHRSIGRDTFWTPAHMAVQFCGVLAGVTSAYVILSTTLAARRKRSMDPAAGAGDASVTLWGFRGPLGAFIAAWGAVAMITSAPFDNWWHAAYGLDVKILSPPHALLVAGILGVEAGGLILALGEMNRARGRRREKLDWAFLYLGGMILVLLCMFVTEYTFSQFMHSAMYYRTLSLVVPFVLVGVSRASAQRWAATTVAAVYTCVVLGCLWILPLFPAEPKLGPVYFPVTHFVPPHFPHLLILPAALLDILRRRMGGTNKWLWVAVAGTAFLLTLLVVQWPFADFLLSPASRNRFFGTHFIDYLTPPDWRYRYRFFPWERTRGQFEAGMLEAWILALVSSGLGLVWGDWMRKIRR